MPRSKRVTLTQDKLNSEDAQYVKLTKVMFEDGAWTEINKKFRDSRVEEMLIDLGGFIAELGKRTPISGDDFIKFLYLHIVLYFSTLIPEMPRDLDVKVTVLNKLINNKYVKGLQQHFDKAEIQRVMQIVFHKLENYLEMTKSNQQLKDEFKEKFEELNLEHKELIREAFLI